MATTNNRRDGMKKHHNFSNSLTALQDATSRVAFLESTRTHHHPAVESPSLSNQDYQRLNSDSSVTVEEDKDSTLSHTNLRKFALDFSLWINIFIMIIKGVAYFETLSLSILAALVDSILDVVSDTFLNV